jgi:hypothetical protein
MAIQEGRHPMLNKLERLRHNISMLTPETLAKHLPIIIMELDDMIGEADEPMEDWC